MTSIHRPRHLGRSCVPYADCLRSIAKVARRWTPPVYFFLLPSLKAPFFRPPSAHPVAVFSLFVQVSELFAILAHGAFGFAVSGFFRAELEFFGESKFRPREDLFPIQSSPEKAFAGIARCSTADAISPQVVDLKDIALPGAQVQRGFEFLVAFVAGSKVHVSAVGMVDLYTPPSFMAVLIGFSFDHEGDPIFLPVQARFCRLEAGHGDRDVFVAVVSGAVFDGVAPELDFDKAGFQTEFRYHVPLALVAE